MDDDFLAKRRIETASVYVAIRDSTPTPPMKRIFALPPALFGRRGALLADFLTPAEVVPAREQA